MGMSLRTSEAVDGGGVEGALATLETVRFVDDFNYGGRTKDYQAAIFVNLVIDGMDKPWPQNYALGKAVNYEVSEDGYSIKGKLNRSSVAASFLGALETAIAAAGLNEDDYLGETVEPLNGLRVRLTNIKYTNPVSGDIKDQIVVGSIVTDEPKQKGRAKIQVTTRTSPSGNKFNYHKPDPEPVKAAVDVTGETEDIILGLLHETPIIKKGDLPQLVAAAAKSNPNVRAIMQQCFKETWLGEESRPWSFDRKTGRLKAA